MLLVHVASEAGAKLVNQVRVEDVRLGYAEEGLRIVQNRTPKPDGRAGEWVLLRLLAVEPAYRSLVVRMKLLIDFDDDVVPVFVGLLVGDEVVSEAGG